MRRWAALGTALAVALAATGCGGSDEPTLKVSAAASVKKAFTAYAREFDAAKVSLSFAGSDELAAQIRAGARPDVFAAANAKLPGSLFADGLVERPVPFARNRLVLAVPAGSDVTSIGQVGRPGVKIAIGSATVPVGSYTRDVLARMGPATSRRILANVRSNEPDVASVVAKLAQGGADAGFVYVTDVEASGGRLRAIELPPAARPEVVYEAAVVKDAAHPAQAREFIAGLLSGKGSAALRAAGFAPPPPS